MTTTKRRSGVFETNSSSSHSITVSHNENLEKPMGDGPIVLTGGCFGWEVADHYDFETKANYVAQDQMRNEPRLALLASVIQDFTGRRCEIHVADTSHPDGSYNRDGGYVDHQSQGTTSELFPSLEDLSYRGDGEPDRPYHCLFKLRQFLFSPHSELHTDNDNR